jgi:hypothetical protein
MASLLLLLHLLGFHRLREQERRKAERGAQAFWRELQNEEFVGNLGCYKTRKE